MHCMITNGKFSGNIFPHLGGIVLGESVRVRGEYEVQEADTDHVFMNATQLIKNIICFGFLCLYKYGELAPLIWRTCPDGGASSLI